MAQRVVSWTQVGRAAQRRLSRAHLSGSGMCTSAAGIDKLSGTIMGWSLKPGGHRYRKRTPPRPDRVIQNEA